jgi:hypothetical protein
MRTPSDWNTRYFPRAPAADPGGAGNTSGMGRVSTVPPQVRGWNWGAFLLNLFWGIGNNTWIALLMLVPFANWVMPFVLGAKGNAWAWQNKRWRDIAHFRRVQRRWVVAGFVVWAALILLVAALWFTAQSLSGRHPVQELALAAVRASPEATELLGTPIERRPGWRGVSATSSAGRYQARFAVAGPRGAALLEVSGRQTPFGWELERVRVIPEWGGLPLVVLPRQRL